MPLPPIEDASYRQLEKDLYEFIQKNKYKTDIAWHDDRNRLCKFLWEKGYMRVE